jgi:CRP-like cAMP-binding protein
MEKLNKLRKMKIFSSFSDDELLQVSRAAVEKIFPSRAEIIQEGKTSQGLFLIVSGEVHVTKHISAGLENGQETLTKLGATDHFGEMSLIDGKPASASIIASEPTICFVLKKEDYVKLLSDNPIIALKLYRFFTESLCERLRKTDLYLMEELLKRRKTTFDKTLLAGSI